MNLDEVFGVNSLCNTAPVKIRLYGTIIIIINLKSTVNTPLP